MRINAVTIGAVTLGSHVMAQGPNPIKDAATTIDRIEIPEAFNQLDVWKFDACHKVDSKVGDLIWPCASKMRTEMALCPTNPTTAEERKAQRDCLCGEGSSLLQDAAACVQCKRENGLQADSHKQHWSDYYKEVDEKYCKVLDAPESYEAFIAALNQRRPEPAAGNNLNRLIGVVADPKSYYETAGVEVPKKQGGGKFTPASPKADDDKNTTDPVAPVTPVAPVVDQVKVPVFVAVADVPDAGKDESSTSSISSAAFTNTTATIRPTASLDTNPSTFLTITTTSTAATGTTSLLPATTLPPGNVDGPVEEHIIVIAGKPCLVYVIWIIIDCVPKVDANGNFAIGFENKGIDEKEAPKMVENKEQFDKVKDVICDGSEDTKLAEQAKQHVGVEGPVVQAPSGSNKPQLPPVSKVPSGSKPVNGPGNSGSQPANDEEECEVVEDVPQTVGQGSQPVSGSKPVNGPGNSGSQPANDEEECEVVEDVPQTVGQGSQPSTGSTPSNSGSHPSNSDSTPSNSGSTPGNSGSTPSNSGSTPGNSGSHPSNSGSHPSNSGSHPSNSGSTPSNSGSTPSNSGSNTCECECPSTVATAFSSSSQDPEICNKKVETETACKKLKGRQMWECLCSKGEYSDKTHFFKEAVQCERRKSNLRESEFEAQILFEVNYRYCQKKMFGDDFGAAYSSVANEWRASRAPAVLV
ncbi:hypothetical protein MY10362_001281 [Beauveria mimosiformis]